MTTVKELRAEAKRRGLTGYSKLLKSQLLRLLAPKSTLGEGWDEFEKFLVKKGASSSHIADQREKERKRQLPKPKPRRTKPTPPIRTTSLQADKAAFIVKARKLVQANQITCRVRAIDLVMRSIVRKPKDAESLLHRWWEQIKYYPS